MDQLFPTAVENVDAVALYAADKRTPPRGRPWVVANMISSIDGAIELDGLSGGLGGPGDKQVFRALRGIADVIIAASGTVIAENYRRAQTPEDIQEMRVGRGQTALPRIAIVSNSLSIEADHRIFDPEARPLIITPRNAPSAREAELSEIADIIHAGDDTVDLHEALRALRQLGANTVLVEGGPTLNAAFVAEDLLDEFCLSFSPLVAGGSGPRVVGSIDSSPAHAMALDRVLHQDSFLFHRYLRARD